MVLYGYQLWRLYKPLKAWYNTLELPLNLQKVQENAAIHSIMGIETETMTGGRIPLWRAIFWWSRTTAISPI